MENIKKINTDTALAFMGCRGDIDKELSEKISICEKELLKEIKAKYLYSVFDLSYENEKLMLSECGIELMGNDIKKHLSSCTKACVMCLTLSGSVDRLIRILQLRDMTKAVITDALASAAVEQLCDELEKDIKKELPLYYQTWRFSPGYGDFPISLQKDILGVLKAPKKIGLYTDENYLLMPCKSVTAVIGFSDKPIEQKRKSCVFCENSKDCLLKRKGVHCG